MRQSFRTDFPRAHYPREASIHALFSEQVRRCPGALAVTLPSSNGHATSLTYAELEARADGVARMLLRAGVTAGERVVIFMERSLELLVATVGVLKAGAAYVPLDTGYPRERLSFMFAEAEPRVILTQPGLRDRLPAQAAPVIELPAGWVPADAPSRVSVEVPATALAYVMFTSGSTGRPKGVAVPHRAVVRLVRGTGFTPLDESRVFLQLAPVSFDAATLEIWGPLLNGGRCVLFPGGSVPDPELLEHVIRGSGVTTLWLTASLFNTIVSEQPSALVSVAEVLTGGEALSVPHVRLAQERLPHTQLVNGYGPTESTTFTTCYRIPRPVPQDWTAIPIGAPIANTEVCVLDEALRPVPEGEEGELCVGGDGLALGYLGRPELTAEKFVPHPAPGRDGERVYRTGDRVRRRPDGAYDFLGRVDDQVKLRGHRIELGEIQAVLLEHPSVGEAVVTVREDTPGNRRLVAYFTPRSDPPPAAAELEAFLAGRLAEVMVPSAFVPLARLPITANGKLDRAALPKPEEGSPEEAEYHAPENDLQSRIAAVWSELLGRERISVDANFFEAGGTSILAIRLAARLRSSLGVSLPLVRLYQSPTIRSIEAFLSSEQAPERSAERTRPLARDDGAGAASRAIAVIGMAGRFPGASSVDTLWQKLLAGEATSRRFSREELDPSLDPAEVSDPSYVPVRGIIDGAECFDHAFFGIPLREAEVMDPQHRVFLEVAYEALEDAGYDPDRFAGAIGLFAGSGNPTYFNEHLCGREDIIARVGAFTTRLGNEKDFLTTRVAYKLGLRGPALTITTACSTSLVTVAQAVDALRSGVCDIALAGGITIHTPQESGYLYQEGSMLAPDGCCRPFDAAAAGTMFNNGCGIVVLKPLAAALADGDRIDAVIIGRGLSNDGAQRMSFSAPTADGQAAAIEQAHADACVEPRSISYVEAHGTATPVGDPIEVAGLARAFDAGGGAPPNSCLLGSVKGNVGHLVNAAGVTGLMKAALALKHQEIPGTLHFSRPNPELALEATPFFVTGERRPWDHGARPRRAGVSSMGVGGTNAHLVLEEAPPRLATTEGRPLQLLTLSASTPAGVLAAAERLAQRLELDRDLDLADVAYTLHVGRRQLGRREAVVACDRAEAVTRLRALKGTRGATTLRNAPVAFMFPGQGSQYLRMGADLLASEPVFREEFERCTGLLSNHLGADVAALIHPASGDELEAEASLTQTRITQPALFATEYALARLWMSWGVRPSVMIGHSIGELVCACVAGVIELDDAARLVVERGRLLQAQPRGSMLSVRAGRESLAGRLGTRCDVAAVNSPSLCVVAGPDAEIDGLSRQLETDGIVSRRLQTSHAFHSAMMDDVVGPFTEVVRGVRLRAPRIPFVSTVTGRLITEAEATDPAYWGAHVRHTVEFSAGLATLVADERLQFIEVGPRLVAATCLRQQPGFSPARVAVGSLGTRSGEGAEQRVLHEALGTLWAAGVAVDWESYHALERRARVALPTYPFEPTRCYVPALPWQDRQHGAGEPAAAPASLAVPALELPRAAVTEYAPQASDELARVLAQQVELMAQQLELVAYHASSEDTPQG